MPKGAVSYEDRDMMPDPHLAELHEENSARYPKKKFWLRAAKGAI